MTEYNKVFLDTNPIIYVLEENKEFYDKVEEFLIQNVNADFVTSTVTVAEYFPHPIKEGKQEYVDAFNQFVETMDMAMLDISKDIAYKAAEIRAAYQGLKTMDALQLATAVISGCDVFLTNDQQLKQFQELIVVLVNEL